MVRACQQFLFDTLTMIFRREVGIAKNKESPDVLKVYDIGFVEYFPT